MDRTLMKIFQYLFVFDFDETLGRTFSPSPNNINVETAYKMAIKSIFGQRGSMIFNKQGGLQNRSPPELIYNLLKEDREKLTESAQKYLLKNGEKLNRLVPREKAVPLVWQSWNPHNVITEMLVRCKLSHLMGEIGTELPSGEKWPIPCQGALEFLLALKMLSQNEKAGIKIAILSSGHDEFIQETFKDVWNTDYPQILITDDDMRKLMYPIDPMEIVKPSVKLFNLTQLLWFQNLFGPIYNELDLIGFIAENRKRMIYFGDDPVKDGQLAESAEVPFGWFNSDKTAKTTEEKAEEKEAAKNLICPTIKFSDWKMLTDFISSPNTVKLFEKGKPFAEIISPLLWKK